VDQDYISKTGDTRAVVGRKIGIGADEVRGLSKIVCKLASRLSNDLQQLGAQSRD
jgi:hypothetical protein